MRGNRGRAVYPAHPNPNAAWRMHQTSSSPGSARCAQRLHWARLVLEDPTATLEPASIDAGQRSYWRSAGQGARGS